MDIQSRDVDGITVVGLAGRMDATTAAEFDSALQALLREGKRVLLISMQDLVYISSAGLRSILGLAKSIRAENGRLAFSSLQPMVSEVFRISGFTGLLPVFTDEATAAAWLQGQENGSA